MTTVRVPPLNLWSAPEWYTLLFQYPLLAGVERRDEPLSGAAQAYYHQGRFAPSAPRGTGDAST